MGKCTLSESGFQNFKAHVGQKLEKSGLGENKSMV